MKSLWKSPLLTALLVVLDVIAFGMIWRESWAVRSALDGWFDVPINPLENYTRGILWKLMVVWIAIMAYCEHYSHRGKISSLNQIGQVIRAGMLFLIGTMAMAFLFKGHDVGRSVIFFAVAGMTLWVWISRTILRRIKEETVARGRGLTRAVIVGAGSTGRRVAARMRNHPEVGYDLLGFVDRDPALAGGEVDGVPVLDARGSLVDLLLRHRVEEVFIATPSAPAGDLFNMITECEAARVHFKLVSAGLLQVITNKVKIDDIGDLPVIPMRIGRLTPLESALKRTLDLAVTIPALVVLSPLLGILAVLVRMDSPGPSLFVQERVGKDGRIFRMFKFRTMRRDTDPYAEAPADPGDPRVTRFGAFLRRTSMDELPQFLNVLRGEMSLVGPRPEMPFIVERYEPWQRRRLNVPQGLTGLWQIAGRKHLPLHRNLEYDFYYIRNWSLLLDLEILVKTAPVVFFGSGAF